MFLATHGVIRNNVLASYLTPTFAYSFRKVVSTATLSCRVRRSSDNAEQNIGFVGNDLDTASLSTFVGAGNGFITTMYEQNGSGIDLIQTNASFQFKIADAGAVYTLNGKPSCITTANDGGARYLQTTSLFNPSVITGVSVFSVTKLITQLGGTYASDFQYSIGSGVASTTGRLLEAITGGSAGNPTTYNQYVEQGLSALSTPYTSGTKLQGHLIKSGNNKFYINNALVGSNTNSLVTPDINQKLKINTLSWGVPTWDSRANQYFSEILIYNSDETSNLTTIQNNINSYYAIY
jgi:hypothetical protein